MRVLTALFILAVSAVASREAAAASAIAGKVSIPGSALTAGARIPLDGQWLYLPGYSVPPDVSPQLTANGINGYVTVPVPQMLSRISWWLDDSEKFKQWEQQRLDALGFDTERASDGWYRLTVTMPKVPEARRVWLAFDGVAMRSTVYCNGRRLGEHAGMFSRFRFELTPHLKAAPNDIAVYVSMEKLDPAVVSLGEAVTVNLTLSKVVSMSKGMFGPFGPVPDNRAYDLHGIWQPVRLEVTGASRVQDAWFISRLDGATVKVTADSGHPHDLVAQAKWFDVETGELVFKTNAARLAESGSVDLTLSNIKPKLWTPDEPNLYQLQVALVDSRGLLQDVYRHRVGFRTFEARGNRLYLNGKRYWIRGANQLPYGKNPWDPALARELIRLMHDGNVGFTRTHCTPWNEAWLQAADEIGLGVSIEGMRPWAFAGTVPGPPRAMMEHWKAENADVIRRCRNHPSVLMWTVGNEMLLRDDEDVEKWKGLSEVVKQTRALDPTRPVVSNSGFSRDRQFYTETLKPAGVDDGDVDDLHSYRGWYSTSAFAQDTSWIARQCAYAGERPIIGQEMATGYPDLDTGLPVRRYSEDLMVPQAWVGDEVWPSGDPDAFGEHLALVTKRTAEQLRYERSDLTSGFMLFSSECWFASSYLPGAVRPYPVYEAVKQAWAPVGLAVEYPGRRFVSGQKVTTQVHVTNDSREFARRLTLEVSFVGPGGARLTEAVSQDIGTLPYYETKSVQTVLTGPEVTSRTKASLRLRLLDGDEEVASSDDQVELFPAGWGAEPLSKLQPMDVVMHEPGEAMISLLSKAPGSSVTNFGSTLTTELARVAVFRGDSADLPERMELLRKFAGAGGTVLLLGSGVKAAELFPEAIERSRAVVGEYVDLSVAPEALRSGFGRFDLKWWARRPDPAKAFVASATHNLKPAGKMLARHVVAHGYIPEERKAEFVTSPLVEIPAGNGRFIVCDLDLDECVGTDPCAERFASQLIAWAAGRL